MPIGLGLGLGGPHMVVKIALKWPQYEHNPATIEAHIGVVGGIRRPRVFTTGSLS